VGKTCILRKLSPQPGAGDPLSMATTATMGVDLVKSVHRLDVGTVKLQIWDTAGQERFRSIAEGFFKGAHGVVVCYDITRKDSFLNVKEWLRSVAKHVDVCDVVLVGNKVDLAPAKRQVPTATGKAAADELGVPFFETSAETNTNIEAVFDTLARSLVLRHTKAAAGAGAGAAAAGAGGVGREPRGSKSGAPAAAGAGSTASATAWRGKAERVDLVELASRPIEEERVGGCPC